MIGGKAPSAYLSDIQNHKQVGLSDEKMNEILLSHRIDPEALRRDDFDLFIERRREQLIQIVERVMGKRVERDTLTETDLPEEDDQMQDESEGRRKHQGRRV